MKQSHIKKSVPSGDWHASGKPLGMGDYYGTGIKNKIGKMRDGSVGQLPVSKKGLSKPPRSLA